MPTPSVIGQGVVSRVRPAVNPDNARDGAPFRSGRYGEEFNLSIIPKNHLLADEGSYFVASNPTHGTGLAGIAAMTGLPTPGAGTDVNPFIMVFNPASDGTRIYLDALQLIPTVVGANGVTMDFGVQLDLFQNRIKQAGAVGGTSITPVNPNMDSGTQSVAKIWAGANVILGSAGAAGAGAGVRMLPHRKLRSAISIVGDVYCITFGGSEQCVGALPPGANSGANCQQSFNYPPVIIGGGQVALIFLWANSQTAASSFEFDLTYWER